MGQMKKIVIAGCVAALGVMAEVPEDWSGTTHDLTTSALTAEDGGAYWVTGSGNVIVVPDNVVCTVALDSVTIDTPIGTNPFTIGAGSTVHLQLAGTSTLIGTNGWSGVALSAAGASLVVDGGLTGTLTAKGGIARPGIFVPEGAFFTMDASNATVKATGGAKPGGSVPQPPHDNTSISAAGLGAYGGINSGTVTVNAGRLEAKGGSQGAGIGGGTSNTDGAGDCGDVIVNGGKVIATTTSWGAGIGGAVPWIKSGGNLKSYTQTGGEVTAHGRTSAGIGGGGGGGSGTYSSISYGGCVLGSVRITGGFLYATSTNYDHATVMSAAIGGGGARLEGSPQSTSGGDVVIEGGTVWAMGKHVGIGAGGRTDTSPTGLVGSGTTFKMTGGTLYVQGEEWAIGGPELPSTSVTNLKSVTVTGGLLQMRNGSQVQVTNGDALGNRPVYAASFHPSDKGPVYVSASGAAPAYEYPLPGIANPRSPSGWEWWQYAWLPEGEYTFYDASDHLLYCDVSPVHEVVHDIATIGTMRLTSASSNAVLVGRWNAKVDGHGPYLLGMGSASAPLTTFLTIRNVTITNNSHTLSTSAGSMLNLRLEGDNWMSSYTDYNPAVLVVNQSTIVIDGPGTLFAQAPNYAAAIGAGGNSCGAITINGGTIYAYGGTQGAGIGCGKNDGSVVTCGPVTVNGGTVRAYGFYRTSAGGVSGSTGWAAGIGCGTGYSQNGGGLTSYTQTGGDVEAYGETAAGIGGGGGGGKTRTCTGGWCGPVKITGGRLVADSLTYSKNSEYCIGAGIGGAGVRYNGEQIPGTAGYLASYEQTGGDVTVRGMRIGIGGGGQNWSCATNGGYLSADTTVKITGGTLTVTTGEHGVHAIGGMEDATFSSFVQADPESINLKSVTITGGSVKLGGDIQVAPSNMVGEAVFAAPTKMKKIDRAAPPLDVSFAVTNALGETSYTYAYAGNGHANDEMVYFWLPNGQFKIGSTGGDMVDSVWTPWSGVWLIIR